MSDQPLHLVATLTARPGRVEDLRAELSGMLDAVRGEPGCLRYDLHRDLDNPDALVMVESWASEAALEAHEKAPSFIGLAARFDELLGAPLDVRRLEQLG